MKLGMIAASFQEQLDKVVVRPAGEAKFCGFKGGIGFGGDSVPARLQNRLDGLVAGLWRVIQCHGASGFQLLG